MVVSARTAAPLPLGEDIVRRFEQDFLAFEVSEDDSGAPATVSPMRHVLRTGLHREQIGVAGPPLMTLEEQLESIRFGRALADRAASQLGARVVALASPVSPELPHVSDDPRHRRMGSDYAVLTKTLLTCSLHVHVSVASREEGVQVLDRIRGWLPVLLAMSANSPFWFGRDTGFASYRHAAWSNWPSVGTTEPFGSVAEYDRRVQAVTDCGAALDEQMVYSDARVSSTRPTVEVRITDVCLDARHSAAIAAMVRALVETAAHAWRDGTPPPQYRSPYLRDATMLAARNGLGDTLLSPGAGELRPASHVVTEFLRQIRPALDENGEWDRVDAVALELLTFGTGATRQRTAYGARSDRDDVVRSALDLTHAAASDDGFPAAPGGHPSIP
ncbi:glutamate--cysteine ligase [Tessaracoccus terricola]